MGSFRKSPSTKPFNKLIELNLLNWLNSEIALLVKIDLYRVQLSIQYCQYCIGSMSWKQYYIHQLTIYRQYHIVI